MLNYYSDIKNSIVVVHYTGVYIYSKADFIHQRWVDYKFSIICSAETKVIVLVIVIVVRTVIVIVSEQK